MGLFYLQRVCVHAQSSAAQRTKTRYAASNILVRIENRLQCYLHTHTSIYPKLFYLQTTNILISFIGYYANRGTDESK